MFGTRTFLLFAIVGCAIVNAEPRLRRSVSHPSTQEVETPSVDDSVAARSVEDPKSVEVSSEAEQDGYLKRLLTPNFKKAFGASAVAGLAFAANHYFKNQNSVDVTMHPNTEKVVPEKVPMIKTLQVEAPVDPAAAAMLRKAFKGKDKLYYELMGQTKKEVAEFEERQKETQLEMAEEFEERQKFDKWWRSATEVTSGNQIKNHEQHAQKPEKRIPNYASCVDPWCNHDKEPSEEEEIEVIDLDRSLLPPRQDASVIDYTALDPEILRKHNAKVLARVKEEIVYVLAIGLIVGLGAVTN